MAFEETDRPAIAELESYGLSLRIINALENRLGFLFIDELAGVSPERLRGECGNVFGPAGIRRLRDALQNYAEGRVVKTLADLLCF